MGSKTKSKEMDAQVVASNEIYNIVRHDHKMWGVVSIFVGHKLCLLRIES